MMEVVVSNVQLLGMLDAIHAKVDALVEVISSAHPELMSGRPVKPADDSATDELSTAPKPPRRTRKKSAYNYYMSEELAKLKVSHPELGHRQRFSMAVKSWKDILAAKASDAPADQTAQEPGAEPTEAELSQGEPESAHESSGGV